jgi:hypothetical protein
MQEIRELQADDDEIFRGDRTPKLEPKAGELSRRPSRYEHTSGSSEALLCFRQKIMDKLYAVLEDPRLPVTDDRFKTVSQRRTGLLRRLDPVTDELIIGPNYQPSKPPVNWTLQYFAVRRNRRFRDREVYS